MPKLDKPSKNIGEITLIGTGGGYGESSVIHLGEDNWIVVDSCINPDTRKSLPQEYLTEIGVDICNDVKLVICTHWHNDHILGISELLEECKKAKFVIAHVNDRRKFLDMICLDAKKIEKSASNASTTEFKKCLKIVNNRKNEIWASQDRLILSTSLSQVFSLSPSDYTVSEFDKEISTLITDFGIPEKKIVIHSPNSKSVVLLLKLGKHSAILGADLEVGKNPREGWLNILDNSQIIKSITDKSTLFKIPHHGSQNGFHERIWAELLEENTVAKLTPWNQNSKLPDIEMLEKLSKKTEHLYMTSKVISNKPKKRDRDIEKMIKNFNDSIREIKYHKGIIRSRINLMEDSQWQIDAFEEAFHVNPKLN